MRRRLETIELTDIQPVHPRTKPGEFEAVINPTAFRKEPQRYRYKGLMGNEDGLRTYFASQFIALVEEEVIHTAQSIAMLAFGLKHKDLPSPGDVPEFVRAPKLVHDFILTGDLPPGGEEVDMPSEALKKWEIAVIRCNLARFRFCYECELNSDPSLAKNVSSR